MAFVPTETTSLDDLVVGKEYVFTYAHNNYTYPLGKLEKIVQADAGHLYPKQWRFTHEFRTEASAPGTYRMCTDTEGFADILYTPRECEVHDRDALVVGKFYAFHDRKYKFVRELGPLQEVGTTMHCPEGAGRGGYMCRTWMFEHTWHVETGAALNGVYVQIKH